MGRRNVKNTMIDKVLEFVAPHLCSGCGKIGTLLCDHCKYDIIKESKNQCLFCNETSSRGICLKHESYYQQAWVVGERSGTLQRLIDGFKFQNMKASAFNLAQLLDSRLPVLPSSTVLVPIPTASPHIRERGYDHMLLVAQYFASLRRLPVVSVLKRGNTATQHFSSRKDRLKQAASAFLVKGPVKPDTTYVLLDDVVTTGSTLEHASRVLAAAGARTIWVGALARQPLD